MPYKLNPNGFLSHPGDYRNLIFYKKAVILYDMTCWFCEHYMDKTKDRTVDQMVQSARSGKQNIVEGKEDGMTSIEMEIKLINVARGSLAELREDYEDQLRCRNLQLWDKTHARYKAMVDYCFATHSVEGFRSYYERWDVETFCNTAITLIHQADRGMLNYLGRIEQSFLENGGIREQMTRSRVRFREQN